MTDYEIEMELDRAVQDCQKQGYPSVNLSTWNSGSEYKEQLKNILKLDNGIDIFDYQYYFQEDARKKLAYKLGFSAEDCKKEFFHALTQSTLSIATIAVLLSRMETKLGIISPYYFSVPDCCDDLKLPYTIFADFMEDINESFDVDLLLKSDCTAFWFTSPLNSCSIYFGQRVTESIQKLLDAGKLVILDESLCINGRELSRTFGIQENLIYIYSPHKALGIQGIKFSVLVAHKKFYDDIDSLGDSYGGSLNYSCQQGYFHFISPNFDECMTVYNKFWQKNLSAARQVLASYSFASLSAETYGHYAMIFIDSTLDDRCFVDAMKQLMREKGYFVYPGVMQCFDPKHHFCFRINLLLNRTDLEHGLKAVLDFFKDNIGADR
ncbi:MAG: hypothetical protein J6U56_04625 [Spirochaetia bacterium]|nr:hypothetical protein [Spirochaetia bacterium]